MQDYNSLCVAALISVTKGCICRGLGFDPCEKWLTHLHHSLHGSAELL